MGIGKFFRTFAERYPMIITPFKSSPPPVDNLYLDMNGIIHNCTHPNDVDATHKAPTEKEMVEQMFSYLEKLFQAVQPRKYFLLAVDGCAPRAKMNQQRQRRYRAGYEMMRAREEALKVGEEIPDEGDVFDSNSITPGTEFMCRLSEQFEYFISMKIQNDSAWRNCTIIFSGQNHPGEGEHKIVDFIRRRKSQPDYDPNETHCMYGLDADLIMLALATHEPHFVLLREVVSFNRLSKRDEARRAEDAEKGVIEDPTLAKPDSFVLLHVNLFREYLDLDIRRGEEFPNYDMEKMIDDFVLMCFLIGNDFLPHVPTLKIADGAIATMFNIYRSHVLARGYHLVVNGKPNWAAMEIFLSQLGQLELETLRAQRESEIEFQNRQAKHEDSNAKPVPPVPITNMTEYKRRYYTEKLGFSEFDPSGKEMQDLRLHYLEGLSWVFEYYYQGPPSWKWYFPHHYAPLASDLVMLSSIGDKIKFDLGQPFLPHQQLLAVLPPMSYRSMPKAYHNLLQSPSSPLRKYLPKHLEIDREGARAPWEGIVLIPFIEEGELLGAFKSVQHLTTEQDRQRNRNGTPVLFKFDASVIPYDIPSTMFEPLRKITVRRNTIDFPAYTNKEKRFVPKLCPGVKLFTEVLEGFSSLSSFIQNGFVPQPELMNNVVNIFGGVSRKESLVIHLDPSDHQQQQQGNNNTTSAAGGIGSLSNITDASRLAHLVGKNVWVGLPHLKRARVSSIVDRRQRVFAQTNEDGTVIGVQSQEISNDDFRIFKRETDIHQEMLKTKLGLSLRDIDVLVFVNRFTGLKLSRRGRFVQVFSDKATCYPLQLVADAETLPVSEDCKNLERDQTNLDRESSQKALYIGPDPPNHRGKPILGSVGYARLAPDHKSFDMAVQYRPFSPQIPDHVLDSVRSENWLTLAAVCSRVSSRLRFSVSPGTITQLASTVTTSSAYGNAELGLCIKFTGKNLARVGYARLQQTQYNAWYVGGGTALFETMEEEFDEGYYMTNMDERAGTTGDYGRKSAYKQHLSSVTAAAGGGGGGGGGGSHSHHGHHGGGHTHKQQDAHNHSGRGIWQFSLKAVALIVEYCERFTPLVERLEAAHTNTHNFDVSTVLRGPWAERDAGEVVKEITTWIEETGIQKKPMASASEETITRDQMKVLEDAISKAAASAPAEQTLHMTHVQQKYVHFPTSTVAEGFSVSVPLPKEQKVQLCCRVVNCRTTGNVPFGASGTVTRLLADGHTAEVVFDEPFVGGNHLGGRLQKGQNRGALVPLLGLLVTSSPDVKQPVSAASRKEASEATPGGRTQAMIDEESGGINIAKVLDTLSDQSLSLPKPRSAADHVHVPLPDASRPNAVPSTALEAADQAPPLNAVYGSASVLSTATAAASGGGDTSAAASASTKKKTGSENPVVTLLKPITPSSNQHPIHTGRANFVKFDAPSSNDHISSIINNRLKSALGEIFGGVDAHLAEKLHNHSEEQKKKEKPRERHRGGGRGRGGSSSSSATAASGGGDGDDVAPAKPLPRGRGGRTNNASN